MVLKNGTPSNYIIILNYNVWDDTICCIESIINSEFKDYQIIIIDNFSTDNSEEKILDYFNGIERPVVDNIQISFQTESKKLPYIYFNLDKESESLSKITKEYVASNSDHKNSIINYPIIYIQTKNNLGFAGGNNIGLKRIVDDHDVSSNTNIFLLNPDTYITDETLNELNKIEEKVFICGMTIRNTQGNEFLGAYKINKLFAGLKKITTMSDIDQSDFIYGGALFTNKRTFEVNGLLPEHYFLYWEEADWCYQAKQKGIKFLFQPSALVYDKVATSIGRGYLAFYYYIRNGLYFYKKYFKAYIPFLLFFTIMRIAVKIIFGNFKGAKGAINGIKDYFRSYTGKLS